GHDVVLACGDGRIRRRVALGPFAARVATARGRWGPAGGARRRASLLPAAHRARFRGRRGAPGAPFRRWTARARPGGRLSAELWAPRHALRRGHGAARLSGAPSQASLRERPVQLGAARDGAGATRARPLAE